MSTPSPRHFQRPPRIVSLGEQGQHTRLLDCPLDFAPRNGPAARPPGPQATHLRGALRVHNLSTPTGFAWETLARFPHRPWDRPISSSIYLKFVHTGTAALRWPLLLHHLTGLGPMEDQEGGGRVAPAGRPSHSEHQVDQERTRSRHDRHHHHPEPEVLQAAHFDTSLTEDEQPQDSS